MSTHQPIDAFVERLPEEKHASLAPGDPDPAASAALGS